MEASTTRPDLRPLSVGEVLDAGFKVYRSHFKTLLPCVLIPVVPFTILQVLIQASLSDDAFDPTAEPAAGTEVDTTALVGVGVTGLLTGLLTLVALAACTRAAAAGYLGRPTTWQESLRLAFRKLLPLLAVILVILLGVVAVAFAVGLAVALAPALGILVGLVALVAFVYAGIRLVVSVPALLVEDVGAVDALKRSWGLVGGRWWPTFGVVVIIGILVFVISLLVQGLLIAPIIAGADSNLIGAILTALGSILASAVTLPLQAAVYVILYFDLRVRKEGFDLALRSEGIGEGDGAPVTDGTDAETVARDAGLGSGASSPPPGPGGFSAPTTSGDPLAPDPEERDRP